MLKAKYEANPRTITNDGAAVEVQVDENKNIKTTIATTLAGEDITNDLIVTEQRYQGTMCTGDTQVLGAPGFLHAVTFMCNDAAPTAGSIIIYDSLTEAGTQVFNHTFTTTPFMPFTVTFNRVMGTGIYVGFTTTNDVNVQVNYRANA